MAKLTEIVDFLEEYLATESIRDYPGALNGLQIENSGTVSRVVAAVDASLPLIEAASTVPGTLLLVHHGMFWHGAQPITGPVRRKIKAAFDGDLALYSSHLPLDVHPVCGNNILLAQALGIQNPQPLPPDPKSGQSIGLIGDWVGNLANLIDNTAKAVGSPVHHCPGGVEKIRRVAVITGGAGSEVAAIAKTGADAFVTGEGPHWSYPLAQELGLNVIYAGHYATETFGVRKLSASIAEAYCLEYAFLDHPSGL